MRCNHCGTEIANDSKFCEHCGKTVKKQTSECTVHVQWLFLLAMALVSASNWGFHEYLWHEAECFHHWDWEAWGLVPVLSFAIFVPCLVLTVKKKLSVVFTVFMFAIFATNTAMVIVIGDLESTCSTGYEIRVYKKGVFVGEQFLFSQYGILFNVDDKEKKINEIKSAIDYKKGDSLDCYEFHSYCDALYDLECIVKLFSSLEVVFGIFYLVYAIIAYKRGWQY